MKTRFNKTSGGITFRTKILTAGKTATGIQIPEDVIAQLGAGKKPAIRVTIHGYIYRSTVAVMGGRFMVGVNDVRAYSRAEADMLIDAIHRRRCAELAAEIRAAHDFEVDDTVMCGTVRGIVTAIDGNQLTVDTSSGVKIWHAADCSSIRDASKLAEADDDLEDDGERE